jgi:hypothetical protein
MAKMDGAMSFGFFSIKPWCMPKTCSAPIFNSDDGCHIEKPLLQGCSLPIQALEEYCLRSHSHLSLRLSQICQCQGFQGPPSRNNFPINLAFQHVRAVRTFLASQL